MPLDPQLPKNPRVNLQCLLVTKESTLFTLPVDPSLPVNYLSTLPASVQLTLRPPTLVQRASSFPSPEFPIILLEYRFEARAGSVLNPNPLPIGTHSALATSKLPSGCIPSLIRCQLQASATCYQLRKLPSSLPHGCDL